MEIRKIPDKRIVEVWLSNEESQNAELLAKLKPTYAACKRQGYLVAVFLSGNQDLADMTSDILCHNQK